MESVPVIGPAGVTGVEGSNIGAVASSATHAAEVTTGNPHGRRRRRWVDRPDVDVDALTDALVEALTELKQP